MFRRIRTFHGTMGISICRIRARIFKNGVRFCRPLPFCRNDGNLPCILRKIRRKSRTFQIHDRFWNPLSFLLHTGFAFQKSGNSINRLHNVRFFSRHHVAWNFEHNFQKTASRWNCNVCSFSNGRRFRRGNGTWHSRNDFAKKWRQSSGRTFRWQHFPSHSDCIPCNFQNDEREKIIFIFPS